MVHSRGSEVAGRAVFSRREQHGVKWFGGTMRNRTTFRQRSADIIARAFHGLDGVKVTALLHARGNGATLRDAADAAGVHVATVCRWQKRDPSLREALNQALKES